MIRTFILLLVVAAVVLLNYMFGSVVSAFISTTIIACILFYLAQIKFEELINQQIDAAKNKTEEWQLRLSTLIKKYRALFSFLLITVVFVAGLITIKRSTDPGGKFPWFLHNDHHGIANRGIAFDQLLSLYVPDGDSGKNQSLRVSNGTSGFTLKSDHLFEPVFAQLPNEKYTPVNNIFPQGITDNFLLKNKEYTAHFQKTQVQYDFVERLFNEPKHQWNIHLVSNDPALAEDEQIAIPYNATLRIPYKYLQEGMSLYNYLLDIHEVQTDDPQVIKVLERFLIQLGNTYLLTNYKKDESAYYTLFPDEALLNNGYELYINNEVQKPQLINSATLAENTNFYVGFHQQNALCQLQRVPRDLYGIEGVGSINAWVFDHPATYFLNGPADRTAVGSKHVRFVTNDEDRIVNSAEGEGFLLKDFRIETGSKFNGRMEYRSLQPNTPLTFILQDDYGNARSKEITNGRFHLRSSQPQQYYLFDVRDFSDNGFSTVKLLIFAALLYLSFLAVLLFFPGKNLARIEPVVLAVAFTLIILRFLMYWRLATFPPLENISKYELENTLLRFDYHWIINWPVPLTLIWTWLFLSALILFRVLHGRGYIFNGQRAERWFSSALEKCYFWLRGKLSFIHLPPLSIAGAHIRVAVAFGGFLLLCYSLFVLNKVIIGQDALTRILAILIPLIAYCYASTRANAEYQFNAQWAPNNKLYYRLKAYVHYLLSNPVFWITVMAIGYFLLTDRGFAILFTLFILLKNIFLNFLKKPYISEKTGLLAMITRPHNFWIYGILALVVYLFILYFKSLFYYLITYKLLSIALALLIPTVLLWAFYTQLKWLRNALSILTGLYVILLIIPPTHDWLEEKTTGIIRHVQYRASIIHQPIGKMLEQNEYSSFQTQKIIETAENQWFINSYINQDYDHRKVFNLRAFSKVGVNYATQTRDVVVARFLIGEWGQFTMYVLLLLCLTPLMLYLLSFKITDRKHAYRLLPSTYAGLLPLLLFFTIALFVWLTSTNRFVFFGQDFPFLSLTSRLSVLLPFTLFFITLVQKPVVADARSLQLRSHALRYAFVFVLIGLFAFTTIKDNALNNSYFSVVAEQTKERINKDVNGIMQQIQDSLAANNKKVSYGRLMLLVAKHKDFQSLIQHPGTDVYTQSILKQLIEQPANGFKINNPVYLQYDNGRYYALYNEHLYMRLPLVEGKKIWNGSVTELNNATNEIVSLNYNGQVQQVRLPYFRSDVLSAVQLGIMPASWLVHSSHPVGILNVQNVPNQRVQLSVYKSSERNIVQSAVDFAGTYVHKDVAMLKTAKDAFRISFSNTGQVFAGNKWVNGQYRITYQQREQNFWVMHWAEALRVAYSADSLQNKDVPITLDYSLQSQSQQLITDRYKTEKQKNNRFKFTAIAADGDGNIRMMAAHVTNRKPIDPNNKRQIEKLRQQHFFFSNVRNERDQWGNPNFLSMQMGPGSSIKPLVAALNASQINAGWEQLWMAAPNQAEYAHYAGYKMIKPWKNVDHVTSGYIDVPRYLEASSNFYQSVMIFLGSYPRSHFVKSGNASLSHVLVRSASGGNGFPRLQFQGQTYYLPSWAKRNALWPLTNEEEKKNTTFFGNENAILAQAFEVNTNLRTKDKDKGDYSPWTFTQANYTDSATFRLLQQSGGGTLLWCFPEQSTFLQSLRAYTERSQNFNLGLKTTALGGYPFLISPVKMLEMYLSMFQHNNQFRLHFTQTPIRQQEWDVDSSWGGNWAYKQFLAQQIFSGMSNVIQGSYGTAKPLSALKSRHPEFFFYAKTGTINEEGSQGRDSRRLILCIANRDLQNPSHIGASDTKLYGIYFTIDNNQNFDWDLLVQIIEQNMTSHSFQQYFQ